MSAPLRWHDGALLVLDQRLLPDAEEWIRCSSAEEVAEAIASMAVRGAPAIGLAAAYGMALAEDRDEAAALLAAARPTASNLAWAVERSLTAKDPLEFARSLEASQMEADRALSALGARCIEPDSIVLTHCNTGPLATGGYGTAVGVLRSADVKQVWVGETRPLGQGARLTAWELDRLGIPFSVIADSAAGSLMARGQVDAVVVGADRIAANGDVANKIGTYPLAVLADRHDIPFYVAAPLSTFDPSTPDGAAIPIEERSPSEVAEGVPAFNPAFDVTPAELVAAIFTEAGLLEPAVVRAARAMASEGLVQGSEGNVSVRVGPLVAITPADLPYEEMGAADLVTLDLAGAVVAGRREPSSERGVHLAIYGARPDVQAIVHTHSPAATASSSVAPVANYAPSGSPELGSNVVAALGDGDAVVMARHGVVAVGRSLDQGLDAARRLEARAQAV